MIIGPVKNCPLRIIRTIYRDSLKTRYSQTFCRLSCRRCFNDPEFSFIAQNGQSRQAQFYADPTCIPSCCICIAFEYRSHSTTLKMSRAGSDNSICSNDIESRLDWIVRIVICTIRVRFYPYVSSLTGIKCYILILIPNNSHVSRRFVYVERLGMGTWWSRPYGTIRIGTLSHDRAPNILDNFYTLQP